MPMSFALLLSNHRAQMRFEPDPSRIRSRCSLLRENLHAQEIARCESAETDASEKFLLSLYHMTEDGFPILEMGKISIFGTKKSGDLMGRSEEFARKIARNTVTLNAGCNKQTNLCRWLTAIWN
jgi:hypothetical protein